MGQWTWYAVQKGRQPGLYRTWDECAAQVKGFPSARFKGFNTREGAEEYVRSGNAVTGGSRIVGMAALGRSVSSSMPPRSVNSLSISATMSSSSQQPRCSVPPRPMSGLSMTAPPSSSSPRPGSSAPVRGMIGISAEVMASLLKLDQHPSSTPAGSVNGLSTAKNISSSTPPKVTINGLSSALNTASSTAPTRTINGLSATPNNSTSTPPAKSINHPPTAPEPSPQAPTMPTKHHQPLSAAAAALSTLPSSSPSSKFYAVATGRNPGVYLTWRECEAQVRGFGGARYKGFGSRGEAVEFLAVYGGGGHFSQFEGEGFRPDRDASFSDEFGRLSSSQGWAPGSQRYNRERARALHNELRTHYFSSTPAAVKGEEDETADDISLAAIKEERDSKDDDKTLAAINKEMDDAAERLVAVKKEEGEEEEEDDETPSAIRKHQLIELQGFQNMCRAVGKAPADTLGGCRAILGETLVNIIDLIDGARIGAKVEVWTDFEAFRWYTLQDDKRMNLGEALKDSLLACFLQRLRNPRRSAVKRERSPCRRLLFSNESKRRRVDRYEG